MLDEPGWLMTQVGQLIDRWGLFVSSLVLTIPVLVFVMLAIEVLYLIYEVHRERISFFGFAYLPMSLMITPIFIYILLKVIDRESRLRRQLERRTLDFEKADRTKSEFLASMSHELRTLLNAILGYSEVIRDQSLGVDKDDVYRKYADDIHRSGSHLLSLINDLLDISKIESGRIQLSDETVNLATLIDTCLTLVGTGLAEKGITVHNDLSDGAIEIQADPRAASQVIVNLLSNAVRHNEKCIIQIEGRRMGSSVHVEIRDDGVGISPGKMETIYEPFTEGMSARVGVGAGLGLPISKRLMDALGGNLRMTSVLGEGTTAILTFKAP